MTAPPVTVLAKQCLPPLALSKDMVGFFFFQIFKFKYCWLSLHTLKTAHFTWHIALFVVSTLCFLALAAGGVFHI